MALLQRFAPRTLRAKILAGTLPAAVVLVGALVLVAVNQSTATERTAEYATAQRAAAGAAVSAELEGAVATIRQSAAATEAASESTTEASANQQEIAVSTQLLAERAAELRQLVARFRI